MSVRAVILDLKPVDGILDFGFWIGGANFAFLSRITEYGIAEGRDKICGAGEYAGWRYGKIEMRYAIDTASD